ncbi:MAG: YfhO family protein, partial [Oscillospiraceae bacterium]|nr:YfhO family protein [Oscillospiraceae bacterium]
AGIITFLAMGLAYVFMGIYPIGGYTGMTVDMHFQYAPLLSKLRDMLLSGSSPYYTFEVGLGTSFLPLFGYYLASPLNLLLVLFPPDLLAEGIFVITLLKNVLCAAAFALCVQYVYRRRSVLTVIAAMMYAMSMYVLAYSWCVMWLDVLIALPLVIMAFEHLMRTGKYLPYVLTLGYALYVNYYIAFMLCLFLVLYYAVFHLREKRTGRQGSKSLLRFCLGSLLAGGVAAFLVIPVYLSLGATSASGGSLPDLKADFNFFDLFGRHLYDTIPTIRSSKPPNLPNIFSGLLSFVALPVFATMKAIPLRRRLTYLGLAGALGLSFVFNQPNLIFHGLHAPNDLPFRFSFLYCFVIVLIAYEVLLRIDKLETRSLGIAGAGLFAYLIIEEKFGGDVYDFEQIWVSALFIGLYLLVLAVLSKRKMVPRAGYMLLLLLVTVELTLNAGSVLKTLNGNEHFTSHSNYVDNDDTRANRAAVALAQETGKAELDTDFFRMDLGHMPGSSGRTCVDTALYNYRGITTFASSNSYNATSFMGGLGYAVNGVNSYLYRNYNPATDSLLGIRYVICDPANDLDSDYLSFIGEVTEGASTRYVYCNPYALPVGYRVDGTIRSYTSDYYNPAKSINNLYAAMTGIYDPVLIPQQITAEENTPAGTVTITETSRFNFAPAAAGSTAQFTVPVDRDGTYLMFVDCRAAKGIKLSCTDRRGNAISKDPSTNEPFFYNADLNAGDTVEFSLTADSSASGNILVLRLDEAVFDGAMDRLRADGLTVTDSGSSWIQGDINASADGVVFTSIPYDAGWSAKIDGETVEVFGVDTAKMSAEDIQNRPNDGAMLAFEVTKGPHTIELSFRPQGLTIGVVITLLSAAALVWITLLTGKRKNMIAGTPLAQFLDTEDVAGKYERSIPLTEEDPGFGEEMVVLGLVR